MNESGSIWPVFACVPALATRWRVQQLWAQFPSGVQYPGDKQVGAEWWTLWRRVAGCLAATEQLRLAGAHSPAYKLEIGAWLLARLKKSAAAPPRAGHEPAMSRPATACSWGRWAALAHASPSMATATTWCRPRRRRPG